MMGYLRPTAIIVSGSYDGWPRRAHSTAVEICERHELGGIVSPLVDGVVNHEQSFLIAWDGSKEGWPPSDQGDAARAEMVAWLREQAYSDGSSPLDWVEVQYGGDDREVVVLAHGDDDREENP